MAELKLVLNGKTVLEEIAPDMLLLDFVRSQGCYSVKRGCETANCGLCTVLVSKELENPGLDEIKEYLSGNLCRCTGYMGQLRAIQKFLKMKKEEK